MTLALALAMLPAVSSVAAGPVAIAADQRAEAAADRLIVNYGAATQLDTVIPKLVDSIMPLLVQGNSGEEQRIREILRSEFVSIFDRLKPDFIAKTREVYLGRFTRDELEEMVRLSETPLGRKIARETPAMQTEMMAFGQSAGRGAVQGAMPRIIDRMRAAKLHVPQSS